MQCSDPGCRQHELPRPGLISDRLYPSKQGHPTPDSTRALWTLLQILVLSRLSTNQPVREILVLTNRPDLVPRAETVPHMSDHEIVYFEFIMCLPKKINNPRPIPLYDKANWSAIREDMSVLHEKMSTMNQEQHTPVEEMWQLLKAMLLESVEKHIPTRLPRKSHKPPGSLWSYAV